MKPQLEQATLTIAELRNKNDQKQREIDKLKEDLRRKEKGFEDKMNLVNNSNKQLSDANMKLKVDLKRVTDELAEVTKAYEKLKSDSSKATEQQTLLLMFKQKEEDYQQQLLMLLGKVRSLEEELQSRIIDGEDVHQQNRLLNQENHELAERLLQTDKRLKEAMS